MKKGKNTSEDVIVMDEGWNAEIRKAVAESMKAVKGIKPNGPKVTDPKKRKEAIEAALKKVDFEKKKK